MKHAVLFLLLLLFPFSQSHAVLQEENLNKTISMLNADLKVMESDLNNYIENYEVRRQEYWQKIDAILAETQELSLVLYSQSEYWIFGMSQAYQRVRNTCEEFRSEAHPFKQWLDNFKLEIQRYQKLWGSLEKIPEHTLSASGRADRQNGIRICQSIEMGLQRYYQSLLEDERRYLAMESDIASIERYNQERFDQIKDRIFLSRSESFTNTLSHLGRRSTEFKEGIHERFFTGQTHSKEWQVKKRQLFSTGFILLFCALAISYFFIYRWTPGSLKRLNRDKRPFYVASATSFLFTLFMILAIAFLLKRYYFIISTRLVLEYTLLLTTVLLSATLRLNAQSLRKAIGLYLPILITGIVLLFYRVSLVPNIVLTFTLPMVLALSLAVQIFYLFRNHHSAARTDLSFAGVSIGLTTLAMILAWCGLHFIALQVMLFWMVCLAGLELLVCIRYYIWTAQNHLCRSLWFQSLMKMLIFPLLYITVFIASIIWAAHIFNMAPWALDQMTFYFINLPEVASISFANILWVIAIGLMFNYLIYAIKMIVNSAFKEQMQAGRLPALISVGTILLWTLYIIIAITTLNINNNAILAAVGGMSMGIGFALKDTLDNLFCGISLMMGRVNQGDLVECDSIRGRITHIGVRSTSLETLDGSIIVFLNNQLFTKNFKNLTKNHNYEVAKIAVGIAYGSDVDSAREIILRCIDEVDGLAPDRDAAVYLDQFGSSSVDLAIIIWVPLDRKRKIVSAIQEKIYKEFDAAGISIPFPQQDVYLHTTNPQ